MENLHQCQLCPESFTSENDLLQHTRGHAADGLYDCNFYHETFSTKSDCDDSQEKSKEEKTFTIGISKNLFPEKKNPPKQSAEEKSFVCDVCNKAFSVRGRLETHKRIHTGEKPFTCDICNKSFTIKGDLTVHRRIHTGEKPYTCDICQRSFSQRGSLKGHRRIHTGEKPYSCDTCDKSFSQEGHLKRHVRIVHSGEKPFVCSVCEKSFAQKDHLNRHVQGVHSGEKPFVCDLCNKGFSLKHGLLKHLKVHGRRRALAEQQGAIMGHFLEAGNNPEGGALGSENSGRGDGVNPHIPGMKKKRKKKIFTGEKPFHCHVCSKAFYQKSHLTRHVRTHTGEKPFHCEICYRGFTIKQNMLRHVKTHSRKAGSELEEEAHGSHSLDMDSADMAAAFGHGSLLDFRDATDQPPYSPPSILNMKPDSAERFASDMDAHDYRSSLHYPLEELPVDVKIEGTEFDELPVDVKIESSESVELVF